MMKCTGTAILLTPYHRLDAQEPGANARRWRRAVNIATLRSYLHDSIQRTHEPDNSLQVIYVPQNRHMLARRAPGVFPQRTTHYIFKVCLLPCPSPLRNLVSNDLKVLDCLYPCFALPVEIR
jgi:hypothetical protein